LRGVFSGLKADGLEGVIEEVFGIFQIKVTGPEIAFTLRRKVIEHLFGYLMVHLS
jgi:hypothetical protein